MSTQENKRKESFLSHLEDLRWHVTRSVIAMCLGTLIAFLNKEFLFDVFDAVYPFFGRCFRNCGLAGSKIHQNVSKYLKNHYTALKRQHHLVATVGVFVRMNVV